MKITSICADGTMKRRTAIKHVANGVTLMNDIVKWQEWYNLNTKEKVTVCSIGSMKVGDDWIEAVVFKNLKESIFIVSIEEFAREFDKEKGVI